MIKIPTLLGLGIIIVGIAVGVYLVLKEQTFLSSAAPSLTPQNIKVTNIEDSTVSITWQTKSPSLGFVTFGQNSPSDQTALDDRDSKTPKSHHLHYVTLKNLSSKTTYKYKIISGKVTTEVLTFTTAALANTQTNFRPVIGSVLDKENPLDEGIAYIAIPGATIQSALVKNLGNFLIPLSKLRSADLSGVFSLADNKEAKVTVVSATSEASAIFNLKTQGVTLPILKIGQSLDFTTPTIAVTFPPFADLRLYDLSSDGKVNAADYTIAQKNKGKNISSIIKDLDTDRIIDQTYLDELTDTISNQNSTL